MEIVTVEGAHMTMGSNPDTRRAVAARLARLWRPPGSTVRLATRGRTLDRVQARAGDALTYQADHGNDVVFAIDVDHVSSVVGEEGGRFRCRRHQTLADIEEPIGVAVPGVGRTLRAGLLDPSLGDDLAILPLAVAQEEVAVAPRVVGPCPTAAGG